MNELALFAGAGGGILGGKLLGWRTLCAVEYDQYAASVLIQRQNDGTLAPFPVWDDVRTFDGKPWRGRIDVVSGGFPCQDISCAGRGGGIEGVRSGLWVEMARIIREVRPRYVFVENSPMLTSRGLGVVLGDLAEMGFNAEWGVIGAAAVGASHRRLRIWVLADADEQGPQRYRGERELGEGIGEMQTTRSSDALPAFAPGPDDPRWPDILERYPTLKPAICRMANGMAHGVQRLRALGNGQVPKVAAVAFDLLRRRGIESRQGGRDSYDSYDS